MRLKIKIFKIIKLKSLKMILLNIIVISVYFSFRNCLDTALHHNCIHDKLGLLNPQID